MFERFTAGARRAIVTAQEEARLLRHNYIGTEHLLLGLLVDRDEIAARAVAGLGMDADRARTRVSEIIGRGTQDPSGHIPFTPRAKKTLELALREGLALGDNFIGTEHLLLGLVSEGEGVAAHILIEAAGALERVREAVLRLRDDRGREMPPPPLVEDTSEGGLLRFAVELAGRNGDAGQLPFAALVVSRGAILATGVNTARRDHDPTAHAAVAAIRAACRRLGAIRLDEATVVSSYEPCALCHAAAAAAGVLRIVYAAPKEAVSLLGDPPSDADPMPRMQAALRASAPEQVVHLPIDGADEPFRRYLAHRDQPPATA